MKRRNKMNSLAVPDFCPTEPSCSGFPQLFQISNPELMNADLKIRNSKKFNLNLISKSCIFATFAIHLIRLNYETQYSPCGAR